MIHKINSANLLYNCNYCTQQRAKRSGARALSALHNRPGGAAIAELASGSLGGGLRRTAVTVNRPLLVARP
jgi:hypothetical protein